MSLVRLKWLICVGLVLVTGLAYIPVKDCDFIDFDDPVYVTLNPYVKSGLSGANFVWAWTNLLAGYWHPMTWLSLQLDAELFGPGPLGFHVTNVLLHIANSVLLFLVFERMTGQIWPSATLAALFALHPMHVESVAWVTERKDVLSTFFWILAMWCYVGYAEKPGGVRMAVVTLYMLLGLLAKPMVVTLPCALLLLDYWPLARCPFGPIRLQGCVALPKPTTASLLIEKWPLFVLAALGTGLTIYAQSLVGATQSVDRFSVVDRITNAITGYVWYVSKTLVPTDLAVFYPHPGTQEPGPVLLALVVLAGLTMGFWRLRAQQPALLVGWLWFLGTLFPVSGVFQVGLQGMADRFSYVPHIGLFMTLVWGSAALLAWLQLPRMVVRSMAGAALLGCAALTFHQLSYWRDNRTIFEHADAVTRDNYCARTFLGIHHLKDDPPRAHAYLEDAVRLNGNYSISRQFYGTVLLLEGKTDQALAQFQEALRINPDNVDVLVNTAAILIQQKKFDEAMPLLLRAEKIHPVPDVYQNLGLAHVGLGQLDDAEKSFQTSLAMQENQPAALNQLGQLYLTRGQPDKAHAQFVLAVAAKSDYDKAYANLGTALGRLGKHHEATAALAKAIALQPRDPSFHVRLALVWSKLGDNERAQQQYEKASKLLPAWPRQISALALQRATPGPQFDPYSAKELALATCEATDFKNAGFIDVLAVAHASLGEFTEAIRLERQALAVADRGSAQARKFEERLRLFQGLQK